MAKTGKHQRVYLEGGGKTRALREIAAKKETPGSRSFAGNESALEYCKGGKRTTKVFPVGMSGRDEDGLMGRTEEKTVSGFLETLTRPKSVEG